LKANIVKVSVFLVLVGLGVGSFSSLENPVVPSEKLANQVETKSPPPAVTDSGTSSNRAFEEPVKIESKSPQTPNDGQTVEAGVETGLAASPRPDTADNEAATMQETSESSDLPTAVVAQSAGNFDAPLGTVVYQAGLLEESYSQRFSDLFQGTSIEIFGGTGISAFIDWVGGAEPMVDQVVFQVRNSNGRLYFGIPEELTLSRISSSELTLSASKIHLVDQGNRVIQDSPFLDKTVELDLQLNQDGQIGSASMFTR
jgi:hypothetical protein